MIIYTQLRSQITLLRNLTDMRSYGANLSMTQPWSPVTAVSASSSPRSLNLILSCILLLCPCQNSTECGTTL